MSDTSPRDPRARRRRLGVATGALVYLLLFAPLAFWPGSPWIATAGRLALGALAVVATFFLLHLAWRRLLWRVGRRLAFSYFLVGVLPLALIALLALLSSYLLGGLLLGHLARDAFGALSEELEAEALARLSGVASSAGSPALAGKIRSAVYRDGLRATANGEAPDLWPEWLAERQAAEVDAAPAFVALTDGRLSAAAVAGNSRRGTLVWLDADLGASLRERAGFWLELIRADDPRDPSMLKLELFGRPLVFGGPLLARDPEQRKEYFRLDPPTVPERPAWTERPLVAWMESTGALPALASGDPVVDGVSVSLAASPRGIVRALLSVSGQADSTAWLALVGVAVLLFEIWAAAAGVALFMIVGLSRAVNRLSLATAAVGRGDFDYRIPVRRTDQVGELQRSFNDMAAHLSILVETEAQKEAIDKELELARSVQRDLLPDVIDVDDRIDLATTFEPSSAIGGDYFDVLARPLGRVAVVIADVAGHGLAAGLRMAMVKSALTLLAEEASEPLVIVQRLDRLIRARHGGRGFVTLTFAEFDPATGELRIVNAGHPPGYLVRADGSVEEISLPGPPLGGLPGSPGQGSFRLGVGDAVVWVSDGIPECVGDAGEVYGYDRLERTLAGPFEDAAALRERLAADLHRHCGEAPVQDDRTFVAMRYLPPAGDGIPSRA